MEGQITIVMTEERRRLFQAMKAAVDKQGELPADRLVIRSRLAGCPRALETMKNAGESRPPANPINDPS